ncbi:MAG: ankyrin repeat domain-containing protein, partial [Gammaproteobacteria bacterium]
AGADPNIQTSNDALTALSIAVFNDNAELMRLLVQAGADPNHTTRTGTIFGTVVRRFGPEVIRLFLAHGADPNKPTADIPPLVSAYENPEYVLPILLDAGATSGKNVVLRRATRRRQLDVMELMLAAGADVNNIGPYGLSVLHLAAKHNAPEVAEKLIAYGADASLRDDKGRTPLDLAQEKNAHEVTKLLSSL